MNETLMTSQEVCGYFRISRTTLDRWIKRGILKPKKIGQRLLFPAKTIKDMVEK